MVAYIAHLSSYGLSQGEIAKITIWTSDVHMAEEAKMGDKVVIFFAKIAQKHPKMLKMT